MFTGIIEETGKIKDIRFGEKSALLTISAHEVLKQTKIGDSIAVNGICLTVTHCDDSCFTADVMAETLRKTSLQGLNSGSLVNLERALAADGRFGGHLVSGHIDGTGKVISTKKEDIAIIYCISGEGELLDGIIKKGSVAIDGISLTVVSCENDRFSVSVIPHTQIMTNLKEKKPGDLVNIETDMIGKYIRKFLNLEEKTQANAVTMDFLAAKGFI